MIKFYKVKYTISPTSPSGRAMRYSRSATAMRMLLDEQEITGTRMSNGGLSYEVLLVIKEGVPIEQFLRESIPPVPMSTVLKIESIEILGDPAQNNQMFIAGEDHHE